MKTIIRLLLVACLFTVLVNEPPRQVTAEVTPVTVNNTQVEKVVDTTSIAPTVTPQPPPPPVKKYTGTKYEWLAQAGVPETDWQYADYIVSKESSWNPNAVNRSSGACSLAQSLPCSKIKGDWRDPVNALKWQYNYVKSRYGSYYQAYQFWRVNHWY
jgi:soluble lytic murein transglycosylase-like protein